MKKDDYLMTMMQVPPKQQNNITPFDLKTQREAFSVSLEGLKGVRPSILHCCFVSHASIFQWNINVLVAESPQAREDRKKRVSCWRRKSRFRLYVTDSSCRHRFYRRK